MEASAALAVGLVPRLGVPDSTVDRSADLLAERRAAVAMSVACLWVQTTSMIVTAT
jgi:hypothetical protein